MRRAEFAAAGAAALALATAPARAQTAPAKLAVAWGSPVVSYLPLWVAYEAGIFKRHALDVDLRYLASAIQIPALLAGEIQIAQVGGGEVVSADAGGADLVVLGVFSPIIPYKLMVPADIKSAAQLKGKKVGVSRFGDASDTGARIALRRGGIDPADMQFLQVGSNATRTAALLGGSIQATVAMAPTDVDLEARGMHAFYDLIPLRIPAPDVGITVRRTFVKDHPDLVQSYIDGIVEGWLRMRADRAFSVGVLKSYFKSDDDRAMGHGYDVYVKQVLPQLPYPRVEQFRDTLEELAKTNPSVASVDPATMLDDSFLRKSAARYHVR